MKKGDRVRWRDADGEWRYGAVMFVVKDVHRWAGQAVREIPRLVIQADGNADSALSIPENFVEPA